MSCHITHRPHVNSVQVFRWQDGVLFVFFFAVGLGLWQYGGLLAGATFVVAGVLTAFALGFLLTRVWRGLIGPVLLYDLIRTARRGRYVLLRCIYSLVLLGVLWSVYSQFSAGFTGQRPSFQARVWNAQVQIAGPRVFTDYWAARRKEMARFAEAFFSTFIVVQLAAVVLLTPAYTAGTIAEEKDRKTLEFLLATDLRDHDIVFGKLFACMANVGMLVLTGLPILGLMQLLGGVDPNLVLAGYAVTGLTLLSIAAISILVSVNCKKARDAIVLSYLTLLAYILVSTVFHTAIERWRTPPPPTFLGTFGTRPGAVPIKVWSRAPTRPDTSKQRILGDLLTPITAGNLFLMVKELKDAWNAGTPLTSAVPGLVKRYAVFHGIVSFYCIAFAVLGMRKTALATPVPIPPTRDRTARRWYRPSLGRQPMIWKEVFAEQGLAFNWFGKAIVLVIVFVSFAYPAWIFWQHAFAGPATMAAGRVMRERLPAEINTWVRLVGTTVSCLTLLGVAVRAAGSITGESDRHTLDNLLTTPLELRTILYGKWLGSILSVRAAWLWLGLVWLIGMSLGGLSAVTLPWLLLIWLVYAGFFACLGQRFSLTSSTTLRATLVTLATLAVLCLGHWLPRWFLEPDVHRYNYRNPPPFNFQSYGLTPPLALNWFTFHGDDIAGQGSGMADGDNPMEILLCIIVGLVGWGLAGLYLWRGNEAKFARLAGRGLVRRPGVRTEMQKGWDSLSADVEASQT